LRATNPILSVFTRKPWHRLCRLNSHVSSILDLPGPTRRSVMSSPSSSPPRDVVIVGAGVIGVCSAFFLLDAPNPPRVTLVEAYGVASGASGKAGGFLALDWHGPATTSLAALSWRLHAELAHTHGGAKAWGFRTMDSVSYTVQASHSPAPAPEGNPALEGSDMRPRPPPLDEDVDQRWLNANGDTSVLGTTESTAQVCVTDRFVWDRRRAGADRYVERRSNSAKRSSRSPSTGV
jgi:hypothetical protein